jgi:hypothetical protein
MAIRVDGNFVVMTIVIWANTLIDIECGWQ